MPATIERPAAALAGRRRAIGLAVAAAALAAALVPLAASMEDHSRTDLTIVNDGDRDVGVQIVGPSGGALHVAHVRAGTTRLVPEVLHGGGDLAVTWTIDGKIVETTTVREGDDLVAP
jgi:hypothetical protein